MKAVPAGAGDGTWRTRPAVVLDNGTVQVVVLGDGGRIASLLDRRSGREWLQPPCDAELAPLPAAGARFTETDHFGWDEMLPTVDPCVFPVDPFAGEMLADHGELWSRTWEFVEVGSKRCTQVVQCAVPPCALRRTITLDGGRVRMEYELASQSDQSLPVLWAAHPQFAAGGVCLRIEPPPASLVDVTAGDDTVSVPYTGDLRVDRDVPHGEDRMYYVPPGGPVKAVVLETRDGSWLRCRADAIVCPYVGLWLDRGRYSTGEVIAVEPTTAYYDALDRAVRTGRIASLAPGEPLRWWMTVEVGTREP